MTTQTTDLEELKRVARELWSERQEDCARFGADISMPVIEVPADQLVDLLDRLSKAEGERDESRRQVARLRRIMSTPTGAA